MLSRSAECLSYIACFPSLKPKALLFCLLLRNKSVWSSRALKFRVTSSFKQGLWPPNWGALRPPLGQKLLQQAQHDCRVAVALFIVMALQASSKA